MARSFLLGLAAVGLASAHFQVNYPPSGFDEDTENTGPCGGVTPVVDDNSPEVSVDQFPLNVYTSHATGSFSLFATQDTEEPYTWTELTPAVVNTTSPGDFCLTHISVPADWAGSQGIIQVIDTGVHGQLFQCSPVRFVEGANTTVGDSCTNSTGFEAEWTNESSNVTTPSTTEETETETSGSAAAATSTGAAVLTGVVGSVLGLGLLAAGLGF